jgi:hypothetical protein
VSVVDIVEDFVNGGMIALSREDRARRRLFPFLLSSLFPWVVLLLSTREVSLECKSRASMAWCEESVIGSVVGDFVENVMACGAWLMSECG